MRLDRRAFMYTEKKETLI